MRNTVRSLRDHGTKNFWSRRYTEIVRRTQFDRLKRINLIVIVMMAALFFIAANRWPQRLGAFLVSFACWDLAYYLFLRIIDDWPEVSLPETSSFLFR